MAGFTGSGGEPNVPNWVEDENSPFSNNGNGNLTGTLSTGYDHILLDINVNAGTSKNTVEIQVNGITSRYKYVDQSGSRVGGASSVPIMGGDGEDGFVGTVQVSFYDGNEFGGFRTGIAGRPLADGCTMHSTRALTFANNNVADPPDSFTVTHGGSAGIEGEVYVYGRNR